MSTFVCSDPHFGHDNMVARYRTQFKSTKEHDETIIRNWNSVVSKRDKVYILGDITMENRKFYHLLGRLNGLKIVVGGNHDKESDAKELLKYVDKIVGVVKYKQYWLTHIPIHSSELRGKKNIHGHIHNRHIKRFGFKDRRYINVSMDVIDYTPVKIDEL